MQGKKADADRRLRKLLGDLDVGLSVETSRATLGVFLERWLEAHASQVRDRTIYGYKNILRRYIVAKLGSTPLNRFQPSQVEQVYAEMMGGGLSPRTVVQTHRILKRALKQAVRWNLINRNPLDLVDPPTFEPRETETLSPEQLNNLLAMGFSTPYGAPIFLAAHTGLRRGEVAGLQWTDVDDANLVISVRREITFVPGKGHLVTAPKSAKGRRAVDLTPSTVDVLKRHRVAQAEHRLKMGPMWKAEGWVFTRDDGSHMNPTRLTAAFASLRDRLGYSRVRLHDLRHTHATMLLQSGVHLKVVQERLGHSTIAITADTYSHVTPGLQKEAALAFEAAMNDAQSDVDVPV